MSQTSAGVGRTGSLALTGTPTAIPLPADFELVEIRVQGSAAFTAQGVNPVTGATDATTFAFASATMYTLPINLASALLFAGSGTLSILCFGNAKLNPALKKIP